MDEIHEVVYVNSIHTDLVKGEDISGHCVMAVAKGIIYHARLGVLVVSKSALPKHIAVHLPTTEEADEVEVVGLDRKTLKPIDTPNTDRFGMPIIRNSPPEALRMLGYGRPERD